MIAEYFSRVIRVIRSPIELVLSGSELFGLRWSYSSDAHGFRPTLTLSEEGVIIVRCGRVNTCSVARRVSKAR